MKLILTIIFSIFTLLINISIPSYSKSLITYKLTENDTIHYQNIKNIKYTPNSKYFVLNQRSYDKKINIFEENGELYNSYNIDDSYTNKNLDLINQNPENDTILTTNYLKEFFGNKSDIYGNTISESLFISDSVLVTIGILNFIINSKYRNIGFDMLSCNTVVLFRINIFTDIVDVIPLNFIDQKLYPQANSLEFVNNHFYFILFPDRKILV